MTDLMSCLEQAPVFNKLSAVDHAELIRSARRTQVQKGQYLCWQDEVWPNVAYIASGRVDWSMLSPTGKRQLVFRLGPCDVAWGHSLFDGRPMPASLEVMEPTEVYIWSKESVMPIVSRNTEAVWDVARILVAYMRHVREVVYGFAFHPVAGRLARFLLNHYQPVDGRVSPRNITLDDMADSIGTTRELVSKTLHRFSDEGMIEISRVQFVFTDRDQLEKLAIGN